MENIPQIHLDTASNSVSVEDNDNQIEVTSIPGNLFMKGPRFQKNSNQSHNSEVIFLKLYIN